jgi:LuxR family maltose regulon positive regulatory protein
VSGALASTDRVAWVGLDEHDAEPSAFWAQVGAALAHAELMPASHTALRGPDLVRAVDDGPEGWLVLDGLDTHRHGAALADLAYLIANLPSTLRLALTTHDAPRLVPVALADRGLVLVGPSALLATTDEAVRIARTWAPDLDVDRTEEITYAAAGWIAGIRCAARQASVSAHPGRWLLSDGAADLLEPWLGRLSPASRRFLHQTVLLDRLSGSLCDAVLGIQDSESILDALESHGGYVESSLPPAGLSPSRERWWSRHPLLSAALVTRATDGDEHLRHAAAADWFRERGEVETVMHHLVSAGRVLEAGEYLREHEDDLFLSGRSTVAAHWYSQLPESAWGTTAWHLLRAGWGQALARDPGRAHVSLARLRTHLTAADDRGRQARVLHAETETLAAYLASLDGDPVATLTSARHALELFCEDSPANSQQIAPILVVRSLLWSGNTGAARRALQAFDDHPFPTDLLREVTVGALHAQCLVDEGLIREAAVRAAAASGWLADHQLSPENTAQFGLMTLGGAVALESGDPWTAVPILECAVDAALDHSAAGDAAAALIWLSRAHLATGGIHDALGCLSRVREIVQRTAPTSRLLTQVDLQEALVRVVGGDAIRAERLLQRVPAGDARTLVWARIALHRQPSSTHRALSALQGDIPRTVISKHLILALASWHDSEELSGGHLTKAADLAAMHGWHMALADYPRDFVEHAGELATRNSDDALRWLVDGGLAPGVTTGAPVITTPVPSGRPLSAGELQLLALLTSRDSNEDLARRLGVSRNTVKTRLYRMYRKLGVDSRDAAIDAARARGLLG